MMRVKFIGNYGSPISVIAGKVYTCINETRSWYRIIDESGEDYLYPKNDFEVIEESAEDLVVADSSLICM